MQQCVHALWLQNKAICIMYLEHYAAHAGSLSDLASEMRLVPEPENPFSHHPTPMQTGRKLQATGRTQDAALAFEAAGMVRFPSHSVS